MSNPKDPKHLKWLTDRLDSLYQTICKAAECLCKLADRPDNDTKYEILNGALVGSDGTTSALPADVDITYDIVNDNLVGTDSNGNVVSTKPLPDDEDTTYTIVNGNLVGTDEGGNQVSSEPLSDNGAFNVANNNAGIYTISHTSSSGGAPQTGIIDIPSAISDSITETPTGSCPAELQPVYLATDIAGNKSFQYGSSPIPSGYQQVADVIGGFTITNIDETTNIISPIQQSANPNVDYYEIASETITFSKADFCLLGKVGKDINILSEINYAYSIDAANDTVNPQQYVYQLGQRILVNGVEVEIDGDNMAMNTSGHHDVIANTILGQWTTDGNNMVVTVQVYVRAQRLGIYNVGDRILTDMIQIGVTMELDQ